MVFYTKYKIIKKRKEIQKNNTKYENTSCSCESIGSLYIYIRIQHQFSTHLTNYSTCRMNESRYVSVNIVASAIEKYSKNVNALVCMCCVCVTWTSRFETFRRQFCQQSYIQNIQILNRECDFILYLCNCSFDCKFRDCSCIIECAPAIPDCLAVSPVIVFHL